ncbi:transporter substrate-binding domain-containing protein [Carboxylicivirga sp. M1479]|uniref:transglycosylase SLT domain-containing protein n=1 Tax=Carboxylicivirga sp. M1479 TaxID=2594476 RepID=UPI001178485F|nr:transporter substrate-binding domain-containing protein [Carboxylicivirga sp. M1479]TRX64243.1 transporter substrate-binding domain-containing protein [Carboxylicivirga sp. M1479]
MKQPYIIVLMFIAVLWSCQPKSTVNNTETTAELISIDLNDIVKRGKIRVVTDYNSTNYFVYKGRPLGYQLELLQALSNTLGIKLEIVVSNDLQKNINSLRNGDVDLIATNLTITRDRSNEVAFTEPHCITHQVLVQQKPDKKNTSSLNNHLIRNQLELAGKTIYVQQNSAYVTRLRSLSNEIGDSINIVEIPDYEVEQLIGLVDNGEIPFTVCDDNLARINLNFYDNIDVETAISFPQKIAWAVRPNSIDLKDVVDNWLISFKKTNQYKRIYRKYFINKRSTHLVNSSFHSIKGGRVSAYDAIIKSESEKHNFDWRLIAALIYQESRFLPEVESWAGAVGLMQLMPQTAELFGVDTPTSPQENIQGGLKFLIWLDKRYTSRIEDPDERLKFVLASYNVGPGHVEDAMRLAEKNNKDPYLWEDNVDYYLLNKSKPSFYNDPVVKYGYCRGEEPYHYVTDILERYTHYKNVITD